MAFSLRDDVRVLVKNMRDGCYAYITTVALILLCYEIVIPSEARTKDP